MLEKPCPVLDEIGAADGSRAFAPAAERGCRATSFLIVDRTPGAVVVANNPINEVDPEGLFAQAISVPAGLAIGEAILTTAVATAIIYGVVDYFYRGERNWQRKCPNPNKKITRDPQTGKKLPPKPPVKPPLPEPPVIPKGKQGD